MKAGYHFKFAFPLMEPGYTQVRRIEVMIDNKQVGEMELLENLGQVAVQTFKSKMGIIYTKTLTRTVLKGLAATEAKKKLREETKANDFWGSVMDAMVDAGVDLTENADLRFWRTLPQLCFIGEFNLPPGSHSLSLRFMDGQGQELDFQQRDSFEIIRGLNLIDTALIY